MAGAGAAGTGAGAAQQHGFDRAGGGAAAAGAARKARLAKHLGNY